MNKRYEKIEISAMKWHYKWMHWGKCWLKTNGNLKKFVL